MLCAQTFGEQILLSPDNRRVVEQKLGAQIDWGNEAVRVLTSKRAEVSLNGAWNFAPAASNVAPRNNEWGFARVPGSWRRNTDVLLQGEGARWTGVNFSELSAGWYQRQVRIPADWNGRTIELDFARVSTDATIYVNGQEAGKISWPEGKLDITRLVTPGQTVTIGAFVVATLDRAEVQVLMGQAPGQVYTAKASLHSGGLVGNVTLSSRPGGAHVSDVFVQPSTRTKQLKLDVELAGVRQAGPVQVTAVLLDEKGKEEKRFTQTLNVAAGNKQTAQLAWTWENPRLWEYLQPNCTP
jgi:beta-galactosidase